MSLIKRILDIFTVTVTTIVSFVVDSVKNIVTTVKTAVSQTATKVNDWYERTVPGGKIATTVLAVNVLGLIFGAGVLFAGIVAGAGLSLSLALLWAGMPEEQKIFGKSINLKKIILKGAKSSTWYFDVLLTATLCVIGFSLGPTMGIVATFLGLNVSAMCSVLKEDSKNNTALVVA
jgi:hypothetical protein